MFKIILEVKRMDEEEKNIDITKEKVRPIQKFRTTRKVKTTAKLLARELDKDTTWVRKILNDLVDIGFICIEGDRKSEPFIYHITDKGKDFAEKIRKSNVIECIENAKVNFPELENIKYIVHQAQKQEET